MVDSLLNSMILAAADPSQHVYNHPFIKNEDGVWLWSGNQGVLVVSGLILVLLGLWVAKQVQTGPESEGVDRYVTKNKFCHMIEVICVYLREEIARPLLKDRTAALMPFLWTLFFFILVNNLLGLVPFLDAYHLVSKLATGSAFETPIGGTATQNIWVTGLLAVIAGLFFNLAAIRRLGIGGYFGHMTAGSPWYVAWLIFVLELAGQIFIKPVALALRLFANMTAGHILLATLIGFAGKAAAAFAAGKWYIGAPIQLVSIGGGIAIMFLEIFVAFLQAFIFMFLTTVFIALMDHDHDHGHDHEHAHGSDHEHAHA